MKDTRKKKEIDKIKLKLEEKLKAIEARKHVVNTNNPVQFKEKLSELRKELKESKQKLLDNNDKHLKKQSNTTSKKAKVVKKTIVKNEDLTQKKTLTKSKTKNEKSEQVNSITSIDSQADKNKVDSLGTLKKIEIAKKTEKINTIQKKKISALQAEKSILKEKTKNPISSSITKPKRNYTLPIILIVAIFIVLGYFIKLRIDLNKEKELLEQQKKEDIDYSKKIIFKEVPDDILPNELQNIEDFKDVPDSTSTKNK